MLSPIWSLRKLSMSVQNKQDSFKIDEAQLFYFSERGQYFLDWINHMNNFIGVFSNLIGATVFLNYSIKLYLI